MENIILDGELKNPHKYFQQMLEEVQKQEEEEHDTKRKQQRPGHTELVQNRRK